MKRERLSIVGSNIILNEHSHDLIIQIVAVFLVLFVVFLKQAGIKNIIIRSMNVE